MKYSFVNLATLPAPSSTYSYFTLTHKPIVALALLNKTDIPASPMPVYSLHRIDSGFSKSYDLGLTVKSSENPYVRCVPQA